MRLDAFLAKNYPEYSRATWQKYLAKEYVKVNNRPAKNAKQNVNDNDEITFDIPDEPKHTNQDLPIIYEDENVIVINKPAGILTHSKGTLNEEFTVADFIKSRVKITGENAEFFSTNRSGIVHRLDRATSGVIIGAKNSDAANLLQKQFSDRKAKKTYLAIVEKPPKMPEARIDLPIGRNPSHPSQFRVDPKGKPAKTDYKIMQNLSDGTALLELKPLTGRTHQLRVHLAYIGSPIVGDPIYSIKTAKFDPMRRMFLHAAKLEITVPGESENLRKIFDAEMPADFRSEIKKGDS